MFSLVGCSSVVTLNSTAKETQAQETEMQEIEMQEIEMQEIEMQDYISCGHGISKANVPDRERGKLAFLCA